MICLVSVQASQFLNLVLGQNATTGQSIGGATTLEEKIRASLKTERTGIKRANFVMTKSWCHCFLVRGPLCYQVLRYCDIGFILNAIC